jgi:hypothetical protein
MVNHHSADMAVKALLIFLYQLVKSHIAATRIPEKGQYLLVGIAFHMIRLMHDIVKGLTNMQIFFLHRCKSQVEQKPFTVKKHVDKQ